MNILVFVFFFLIALAFYKLIFGGGDSNKSQPGSDWFDPPSGSDHS